MSSPFSDQKSKEFYDATRDGVLPLVKSLSLDPKVNLNWQDKDGHTPFYISCIKGHVAIVRYLLDFHDNQRPIDFNLAEMFGNTPFIIASAYGHEKVVEMLADDERIDVNRPDESRRTPLWFAAYHGHVVIARIILASRRKIDVEKRSKDGKTAAETARDSMRFHLDLDKKAQRKAKELYEIIALIETYEKDPEALRQTLRREIKGPLAGELFALVVYLTDGYLKIEEGEENVSGRSKAKRFFKLASLLPLDLQMVLCNRVFGLEGSIVKKIHSEQGFKKFARE